MVDTPLSGLGAARAYQSAKKLDVAPTAPVEMLTPSERPSFVQLLETTAREQVATIRAGEAAAVAGLKGQMPMQQVVEATMAMETALQVTISLRDRVVEAYQEVLRMSV
jgi:flagellar hook-basal body complex protein FliE